MLDRPTGPAEEVAEMKNMHLFIEKMVSASDHPRCVDGRPAAGSDQGPQMLGGSLHPILLEAIFKGLNFDESMITDSIAILHGSGVKTGVHKGTHAKDDAGDCGFADHKRDILGTAVSQRDLITERLQQIVEASRDQLNLDPSVFAKLLGLAYEKIASYSPNKIKLTGEPLVRLVGDSNSKVETVEGDHAEQVVFINLKKNTTLDTAAMNRHGRPGFNLDLPIAIDHAKRLDIPEEFTVPASLILYMATEIVLVENKGKPALPIEIRS